jgi:hypothetical protein
MASISLKISIVEKDVVKTMQFDPNTAVYDACRVIRDKITEANLGQRKSIETFSLFISSVPYLVFIYSLFFLLCNLQLKITAFSWPMRIPKKAFG